jgi:hypothetical protein
VATAPGCGFSVFEDVGADPHPPTIQVTGVARYVEPAPTAATARPGARNVVAFTLRAGDKFQVALNYADSGGDIMRFKIVDLDGPLNVDVTPVDATYFPGTSGSVLIPEAGQELSGVAGRHRIEVWAEDSHLTRSEHAGFELAFAF